MDKQFTWGPVFNIQVVDISISLHTREYAFPMQVQVKLAIEL